MNLPLRSREVLIAELLGEVDALLTRAEKLPPALDAASAQLALSVTGTKASLDDYRLKTQAVVDQAQTSAVKFIVRRTNELAENSLAAQTVAMQNAARRLFALEVTPRIGELGKALDDALVKTRAPGWHRWASHAATALIAASATAGLLLHVLHP